VVVVEDNANGVRAANHAGCRVLAVRDQDEVTYDAIRAYVSLVRRRRSVITLVPMAGPNRCLTAQIFLRQRTCRDRRRPLVPHVIENLSPLGGRFVVVIRRGMDARRHHLEAVIRLLIPHVTVVVAQDSTAGAACTALLAVEHLPLDEELIIANGDQVIRTDLKDAVGGVSRTRTRRWHGGV